MERDLVRVGRPFFDDDDISTITSKIAAVLRSGHLTSGSVVKEFEERWRAIAGTKHAVGVSSCTAALHTLMCVLGLGPGDEVVVPANTFVSTANSVLYAGATPVFADCDPETFNVTASTLERSITPRTRAIIVVHLAGNPCDMGDIVTLCDRKKLLLVEDCAHAVGSKYEGRPCGTFGIAGAFSFYPTKVITSGEGGMILTDSDDIALKAKTFRNVGRAELGYGPITMLGYNYRMSDIHACIGISQLEHLEQFLEKRTQLAKAYGEALHSIHWLKPQKIQEHTVSAYYSYICRLLSAAPVSRDELIQQLRERNIETTVMYRPVHTQPFYSNKYKGERCPNAELLGQNNIVLPLHAGMTADEALLVMEEIRKISAAQ